MPAPRPPVPPPLLFAAFLAATWLLQRGFALPLLPDGLHAIPALFLSLGGLLLFFGALRALKKAGTSPSPYREPSALVTTGPYMRSRNPIYFAFLWIYLGLAAWMNSGWGIVLLPLLIIAMNRVVIAREEEILEQRFGEGYRSYRERTRRWM